ncbi:MAG: hypothetical protein KUA43_18055 [Hoeflea sp.]|uniref:hypothetical protein n=1 Tax=Hoeflea sp. TaxID=1940281 RepID=UPI001DB0CFF2|nr:hypothetical protein [Hoeflea sp.]MBU4529179.1 hypothetical protein [Alphaproteobacteria bacterium]MBU4543584.1 hypothetical protein [Alphaproteobacteria bacterium]MBU4549209.1 hypothetical protein [Alphaproteobacteria bacterium]MBV1725344.1 hypothetical protein [Hoeflea sp.]MBV1785305.1 hypothetical protein [Hoeflea sp.]
MVDRYASVTAGLAAPYTDAAGLVPGPDEFEPTAAINVNAPSVAITVVMLDRNEEITLELKQGLYPLRVKKLAAVSGSGTDAGGLWAVDMFAVVGLW